MIAHLAGGITMHMPGVYFWRMSVLDSQVLAVFDCHGRFTSTLPN